MTAKWIAYALFAAAGIAYAVWVATTRWEYPDVEWPSDVDDAAEDAMALCGTEITETDWDTELRALTQEEGPS